MLTLNHKIDFFKAILVKKESNYADTFNANIILAGENCCYVFLENLKTKTEIQNWINKLKTRIIMKEDEDVLEDIIDDFILCE